MRNCLWFPERCIFVSVLQLWANVFALWAENFQQGYKSCNLLVCFLAIFPCEAHRDFVNRCFLYLGLGENEHLWFLSAFNFWSFRLSPFLICESNFYLRSRRSGESSDSLWQEIRPFRTLVILITFLTLQLTFYWSLGPNSGFVGFFSSFSTILKTTNVYSDPQFHSAICSFCTLDRNFVYGLACVL